MRSRSRVLMVAMAVLLAADVLCGATVTRATVRQSAVERSYRADRLAAKAARDTVKAIRSPISTPLGITADHQGHLYVANSGDNTIGRISTTGAVTSFSGAGIARPHAIAVGADGAKWFTNYGNNSIGRLSRSGKVTTYTGHGISRPYGIVADGTSLWFTNYGNRSIGRITDSGRITNYRSKLIDHPESIVVGPDKALWFNNFGVRASLDRVGSIGRITPGGSISRFPVADNPAGIVAGPDGAVWFTDTQFNRIGRIDVLGQTRFFNVPVSQPGQLTVGPDKALWFVGGEQVGRLTTSGHVSVRDLPRQASAYGIATGSDHALWVTSTSNDTVYRFTPGHTLTRYLGIDHAEGITAGAGGVMWFADHGNDAIGRITASGKLSYYTGHGILAPRDIVKGPDGAMWFTNAEGIGRITTKGKVKIYGKNRDLFDPEGITVGPDKALWFADGGGAIGRITTHGKLTVHRPRVAEDALSIAVGPDKALWFTGQDEVGRITTAGKVSTHLLGSESPTALITAPDHQLWVADIGIANPQSNEPDSYIERVHSDGTTTVRYLSRGETVTGMAIGPDGAVWFANSEFGGNDGSFTRMTTGGALHTWSGGGIYAPYDVATGPKHHVWFTTSHGLVRVTAP